MDDSAINDFAQQLSDSLANKMTIDGFNRLKAHVQSEKKHMIVFSLPSMPPVGH